MARSKRIDETVAELLQVEPLSFNQLLHKMKVEFPHKDAAKLERGLRQALYRIKKLYTVQQDMALTYFIEE